MGVIVPRFSNFANFFPNTPISAPTLLQSSSKFIRASIGLILKGSAWLNHKITDWGKNRIKNDNFHFYSHFCPIILKIAGYVYHGIISVKMNFCKVSPKASDKPVSPILCLKNLPQRRGVHKFSKCQKGKEQICSVTLYRFKSLVNGKKQILM